MRSKKRLTAFLLILTIILSTVPIVHGEAYSNQNVIYISSQEDLLALAEACSLDTYSQGKIIHLTKDIILSDDDFTGIPTFGGTFNGNGHTIRGLKITKGSPGRGLFRYIQSQGQVINLNVVGFIAPMGSRNEIGGIAGVNYGTISNCTFEGAITGAENIGGIVGLNETMGKIKNCYSTGTIIGERYVGGIAGKNLGSIYHSSNGGDINTALVDFSLDSEAERISDDLSNLIDPSVSNYITGDTKLPAEGVTDPEIFTDVGGITGYSLGIIQHCKNTGEIGYPHVGYNIGGIAGRQDGYLSDCSNTGDIYGRKDVGGIVGQMEPFVLLQYSEDTLQGLNRQLSALGGLFDNLVTGLNDSSDKVSQQLSAIMGHMDDAGASTHSLLDQTTDFTNETIESINNDAERLSGILAKSEEIFQQMTYMAEDMGEASESISKAFGYLEESADESEEAIGALSEAFLDFRDAAAKLKQASKALGDAIDELKKAIGDSEATKKALEKFQEAIHDASSSLDAMNTAIKKAENAINHIEDRELLEASKSIQAALGSLSEALKKSLSALSKVNEALAIIGSHGDIVADINRVIDKIADAFSSLRGGIEYIHRGFGEIGSALASLEDAVGPMGRASGRFEDAFKDLTAATDRMEAISRKTKNIVSELSEEPLIKLPVLDSFYSQTIDDLFEALTQVSDGAKELNKDLANSNSTISEDFKAINGQIAAISDFLQKEQNKTMDQDQGIFEDNSDSDILKTSQGKVFNCTNSGAVSGDINIGGITGAMAKDYVLDPEGEVTTSGNPSHNFIYKAKAIIHAAVNHGQITSKKDNAGGIVGQMDLGTVIASENYGAVESTDGSYVGGIAGVSKSSIRSSYVMAALGGTSHIGGIAGTGKNISDSYTYVKINSNGEYLGAIAGEAGGEVKGNFFVKDKLDGIDGISYAGKTIPQKYEDFILAEGLPAEFKNFHLRFVAAGEEVAVVPFSYGDALPIDQVPKIPPKEGYSGKWPDYDYSRLTFNETLEAQYRPLTTVIGSLETRKETAPIMLAESTFTPEAKLTLAVTDEKIPRVPLKNQQLLESWAIKTEGLYRESEDKITVRYLPPEANGKIHIWIYENDRWSEVDYQIDGSYLVFQMSPQGVMAASEMPRNYAIFSGLVLLLIGMIAMAFLFIRKGKGYQTEKLKK